MQWWKIPDDKAERQFLIQRSDEERRAIEGRQKRTENIAKNLHKLNKGNGYAEALRAAYGQK